MRFHAALFEGMRTTNPINLFKVVLDGIERPIFTFFRKKTIRKQAFGSPFFKNDNKSEDPIIRIMYDYTSVSVSTEPDRGIL